MGRTVVLFVAAVAAVVLAVACGAAPQRVEVGELRTETRSVEVENAESVKVNLRLAVGELDVGGAAEDPRLMEADFAYNVAAWEPGVDYEVVGDSGELSVQQRGLDEGIPTRDVRNEWDLRLNDRVPVDLTVQMGGGVGNLDLDNLALAGLNLDVGAGSTRVDLSGDWGRDLSAVVRGGAGQVTVLLPSRMGARVEAGTRLGRVNAEGLRKEGDAYVNDAYGDSDATLKVEVTGGVGQINLEVVQQQEGDQQDGTGGTTMMQDDATTTMQPGGTTMMQGTTTAQ
jgi:predicted membrane protein